jgi:tripartite-type tricarboxylate transporter receptor subunit TctC
MVKTRRTFLSSGLIGAVVLAAPLGVRAAVWPQRPVRFIVPFGPGAGADIGARIFAERLQALWGQPVVVENRPGGDSILAITAFLNATDDHTFLFAPAGNFTVHPFIYSKLSYDPNDIVPIARVSNTILAVGVKADSPFKTIKEFTEAARQAPGKYNGAMVQGVTEFTFWGYEAAEGLNITQVPYRDINSAAVDLGEGRIEIAMLSYAMLRSQVEAGRVRLIVVNNATRAPFAPDLPTAREAGYPSLEVEGLVGLFGITGLSNELKEKIAADIKAVSVAPIIAERLKATGQVVNCGGPQEFAAAIAAQRAKIAATVKAIDFKPKL